MDTQGVAELAQVVGCVPKRVENALHDNGPAPGKERLLLKKRGVIECAQVRVGAGGNVIKLWYRRRWGRLGYKNRPTGGRERRSLPGLSRGAPPRTTARR